jgi:Holliday junction resolvase
MILNDKKHLVKESIEIKQQKKESTFLGSIKIRKGHFLFKIKDGIAIKIEESDYRLSEIDLNGKKKKELIISKDFVYISALNKKNALKKFFKS